MPSFRLGTRYIINKQPKNSSDTGPNIFIVRKNKNTNKNRGVRRIKKIEVRSNYINPKVKYPKPVTKGGRKYNKTMKK